MPFYCKSCGEKTLHNGRGRARVCPGCSPAGKALAQSQSNVTAEAERDRLRALICAYRLEHANPGPDYVRRRELREQMFAAIDAAKEEVDDE